MKTCYSAIDICDIYFALSKELYQHNKAIHKKEKELLTCEICGRKFKWEYKLTEHRFIHGLKDATIDEDNLSEFCKDPKVVNLLDRRQKNNVKKNFHCKICDKEVFFGRIVFLNADRFFNWSVFAHLCSIAFAIMLTTHFEFLSETEKSINTIGALCVFP